MTCKSQREDKGKVEEGEEKQREGILNTNIKNNVI